MYILEIILFTFANINVLKSNVMKNQDLCVQYNTCSEFNSKPDYNLDEYATRNCYCDDECLIYNDCCENYPVKNNSSYKKQFVCNLRSTMCDEGDISSFIYSIGECPSEYTEDLVIKLKCLKGNSGGELQDEDKFLKWPFYSNRTNYTYNNIYCAICNGEQMLHLNPWQAAFRCDRNVSIANNTQILEKMKKKCSFVKWRSSFMKFRYCRNNVISTCLKNDSASLKIESKCLNGPYKIRYSTINKTLQFRNEFCAECSGYTKSTCFRPINGTNKYKCIATEVTWSLFFDFNFFNGEYEVGFKKSKGDVKLRKCDAESFYDPFNQICSKIVYKNVEIKAENVSNCKIYENSDIILLNEAKSLLNHDIQLVDYTNFYFNNQNLSISNVFLHSQTEMALVCYTSLIDTSESFSNSNDGKFTSIHKIITIVGIVASLSGLVLLIIIYIRFPTLRNLPGKDLLCLSSTYICIYLIMIASMILLKVLNSSYKGYLQQKDNDLEEPKSLKIIKQTIYALAVLLHYTFLCTFSWISIISYDICKTLTNYGNSIANKSKEDDIKIFKTHLLFGYLLIPSLPVLIGILLDTFKKDSLYAPNYGYTDRFTFWISNRQSLFMLFIVPVTIMLLINLIFFSLILNSVLKTDNSTNRTIISSSAKQKRQSRIVLFIKLLTIMGLCWLLGLLAGYYDKEWLFLIYTMCNVFQGFFIFLAFIFNHKVSSKQ